MLNRRLVKKTESNKTTNNLVYVMDNREIRKLTASLIVRTDCKGPIVKDRPNSVSYSCCKLVYLNQSVVVN